MVNFVKWGYCQRGDRKGETGIKTYSQVCCWAEVFYLERQYGEAEKLQTGFVTLSVPGNVHSPFEKHWCLSVS